MIKEIIKKFIYNLLHRNPKIGGLEFEPIGDGASPKYRRYREEHGEEIFGFVPPETLGRARKIINSKGYPNKMMCYQDSILSCVSCTICELKNYFTDWTKFFSWRWIYGQVPHFNGGTRFKDNMRVAQKGMLLDKFLPQSNYWGGEMLMRTIHLLKRGKFIKPTKEELEKMKEEASKYTLGAWKYIYWKDRTAIKHALTKSPLPCGVYVQRGNWFGKRHIYWQKGKAGYAGHLILLVDWDDKKHAWWITDHDGRGLKLLDYNYPLAFVAYVEDGKTAEEKQSMLRVVKLADDPKFYVVWQDNTKSHIPNWELYLWGVYKGIWVNTDKVEVLSKKDFDRIPTDEQAEYLLEIMRDYNASHKKIENK